QSAGHSLDQALTEQLAPPGRADLRPVARAGDADVHGRGRARGVAGHSREASPAVSVGAVSKRGALALVTLAHGLGSLSILAVAPLSPFLLEGWALSRVQAGLFLPAAYLGGMLFALPAGWLTERRGVRWPLVL